MSNINPTQNILDKLYRISAKDYRLGVVYKLRLVLNEGARGFQGNLTPYLILSVRQGEDGLIVLSFNERHKRFVCLK